MISAFTTIHTGSVRYLHDAHASLLRQTVTDWEWFIGSKPDCPVPADILADPRVRTFVDDGPISIGSHKRFCCTHACGDLLVELDADDELFPLALERIQAAFDAGADFVYADCAAWVDNADGTISQKVYDPACGWSAGYEVQHRGATLIAMHAAPVTPQNLRTILFAPDHPRAWTRKAYEAVGGYDASLVLADDHDLMAKMYLNGAKFVHVPECLYAHRFRGDGSNATISQSDALHAATWSMYGRHRDALAKKFAHDNGLASLVLYDVAQLAGVASNSVGLLRADGVLDDCADQFGCMNEMHRVLAPGGYLYITGERSARLDRQTFVACCDPAFAAAHPAYTGRFQLFNSVDFPRVEAQLVKLGPGYAPMGLML